MLRVIVSLLPVVIAGAARAEESPRMDFRTDVIAALSRGGCNQEPATDLRRGRTASASACAAPTPTRISPPS